MLKVYPRLLSYVLDDPEGKDISGVKGAPSEHCCEQCWVPFNKLADITLEWPARTELEQKAIYNSMCDPSTSSKAADDIGKRYSTHKTKCALWGFADQEIGVGNSLHSFGFESMHNEDLGVFVYIIDHSKAYFTKVMPTEKLASDAIMNLNQRMKMLPRWGTYDRCDLVFYISDTINCHR